ncbi:hypothetical protein LZ32DRAFT_141009 [Colletotrichum eremochloae]|nr:hypothetical protein LZ32DRAFT_141009 [Colletotrichum eremochloae]
MAIGLLLIFGILASQALAFPAEPPQPASPETWSLMGFRRACSQDQAKCTYSFLISEVPTKAPKYCNFIINAAGGRPAYQTDFSVLECPGAPEYTVNGGWDERKFVTLTVINKHRGILSFFAARDADLWAGNETIPQNSNVFNHPIPTNKREIMQREEDKTKKDKATDDKVEKERKRLEEAKRRQENKDKEGQKKLEEARERDGGIAYASEWKLVDVTRCDLRSFPGEAGDKTDKVV